MGRHAELKGHSAARVGLTPILAPDPTACKWPIPSGSEVRPAMLPNVAPGAMRTLEDPMTGVQQSADVAVAPGKPTCFHLVDPKESPRFAQCGCPRFLRKATDESSASSRDLVCVPFLRLPNFFVALP